jgi:DNA polymerase-3 subunit alpha (Gram-positive type)
LKIKYLFPKAHAAAYVMMAFRIAYFKVHMPAAFYATYFTVRADEFDADLVIKGEEYIRNYLREIQAKGNEASAKEKNVCTILEIVLEAILRGVKFLPVDLYHSDAQKFLITENGLRPPLASLQGLGVNAARSLVQAREEQKFYSIEDLKTRARLSSAVIEVLKNHGCLAGLPERNQLSLF